MSHTNLATHIKELEATSIVLKQKLDILTQEMSEQHIQHAQSLNTLNDKDKSIVDPESLTSVDIKLPDLTLSPLSNVTITKALSTIFKQTNK